MSTQAHICFVSSYIFPVLSGTIGIDSAGGAEVQQTVIARALNRAGYRISVLTKNFGQGEVEHFGGIAVHRLPDLAGRGIKGVRLVYPRLTDIVASLKTISPDIVYQRVAGGGTAAVAWYARAQHKKFIYAAANDLEFGPQLGAVVPNRRERMLFRLGLRRADLILLQNYSQRQRLKQACGRDGEIIPNCYEESEARPGHFEGPVLWVSSVKPFKRPELFIQLAQRLPERRFRMIGGAGPNAETTYREIQASAARLPNVDFLGFVPFAEVGRHFDGASLFVNTSESEGFPNTFLQSWVRGIPTVSFVRPEVVPGETGTIACSDLDEMVSRIAMLSSDRAAWLRASCNCVDHFRTRHSVDKVLLRYESIFDRLLKANG